MARTKTDEGRNIHAIVTEDFGGNNLEFAKKFVQMWQTSSELKEIIEYFGAKKGPILSLSSCLRRKGVPLRKFHYTRKYDYPVLIKLAEEYKSYGRVETKRNKNGDN